MSVRCELTGVLVPNRDIPVEAKCSGLRAE